MLPEKKDFVSLQMEQIKTQESKNLTVLMETQLQLKRNVWNYANRSMMQLGVKSFGTKETEAAMHIHRIFHREMDLINISVGYFQRKTKIVKVEFVNTI